MSLRILFADDSVTAQNMGKKILADAGYDVIAVSNGAAAVKKIAEQKPDIIILDVYMPGYSGLEVCEKVRGSMETAKIPVLLTVGKMEPYKPEDANRVKADGVIVKPFEATDLLAIVKTFEERIRHMAVPVEQTVLMEHFDEEEESASQAAEQTVAPPSAQPTVEVPDHMATSSAFSDLLGADPSHSAADFQSAPPPPPPAYRAPATPAKPEANYAPIDYEVPPNWRDRDDMEFELPKSAGAATTEPELERKDAPAYPPPPPSRPLQIPVYQEREPAAHAYEVMPTAAQPTGEIEIVRDPELQESAAETTRSTIVDDIAPGLIPNLQEFLKQETEHALHPRQATEPAPRATPQKELAAEPVSDADFEARVAAAMSAYSRPQDTKPAWNAAQVPAAAGAAAAPGAVADKPAAFITRRSDVPAELDSAADEVSPPSFEYRPPVSPPAEFPAHGTSSKSTPFATRPSGHRSSAEAAQDPGSGSAGTASQPSWPEPASLSEVGSNDNHVSAPSSIEASALAAAAAAGAETGADTNTIAQAVHRVMERLKPELVDEIVRELKSKK